MQLMRWIDSHIENKHVFSLCLNVSTEMSGARRSAGRLFHVRGPCTAKLRCRNSSWFVEQPVDQSARIDADDRRQRLAIFPYVECSHAVLCMCVLCVRAETVDRSCRTSYHPTQCLIHDVTDKDDFAKLRACYCNSDYCNYATTNSLTLTHIIVHLIACKLINYRCWLTPFWLCNWWSAVTFWFIELCIVWQYK